MLFDLLRGRQGLVDNELALDDVNDRSGLVPGLAAIQSALENRQLKSRRVEGISDLVRQPRRHRTDRGQTLRAQRAEQHLLLVGHVDAHRVDQR